MGGAFGSLFCPEGRAFYTMIVPAGGFLLPSSRVPGVCPGGMVMDEIDTCINLKKNMISPSTPHMQEPQSLNGSFHLNGEACDRNLGLALWLSKTHK